MAILVSVIRPGHRCLSTTQCGIRETLLPGKWDSPKFALGADGGWIEKENDIRDVDEISSRRMRNSSAKGAGIRDQDAPTPLSRPHFMWVFPRMKLNPGYVLMEMNI